MESIILPAPIDTLQSGDFDFEPELRALAHLRDARLLQETGGLGSLSGRANVRGKYSVVCRHWLRDLCMKGERCDFLHQFEPDKMPECTSFARHGKCLEKDCEFKHDLDKADCPKYRYGYCKAGLQCRLRHEKLPRQFLPDLIPDWFLKELIPNIFDFVARLPESADNPSAGFGHPQGHFHHQHHGQSHGQSHGHHGGQEGGQGGQGPWPAGVPPVRRREEVATVDLTKQDTRRPRSRSAGRSRPAPPFERELREYPRDERRRDDRDERDYRDQGRYERPRDYGRDDRGSHRDDRSRREVRRY